MSPVDCPDAAGGWEFGVIDLPTRESLSVSKTSEEARVKNTEAQRRFRARLKVASSQISSTRPARNSSPLKCRQLSLLPVEAPFHGCQTRQATVLVDTSRPTSWTWCAS